MAEALIATKFFVPVHKPQYVERPQLQRKLRLGLERKLILVSAPPGFGKTTLLSSWLSRLKTPCTWLSLDEQDNSPHRFLRYLVASIQKVTPGFGEVVLSALDALPQPPFVTLIDSIANELAFRSQSLLLVLDDYQFIDDAIIHDGLIHLIELLPITVHFCIATRSDPPWKIARLRAQQDLLEIRTDDLRFDSEETAQLMEGVFGIKLEKADLRSLTDHTEGWVAALQMAASSLQNTPDVHSFIHSFTGSNRAVVDYLIEEVLNRQSPEVRNFLVQTSILDQMNSELCDSILGRNDSHSILDRLEKTNLFLQPTDDQRSHYRYHQLFRELLQNQLKHYPESEITQLHRNASAWFLVHDDLLNSLKHALKAGDLGIAANIAEQHALEFLDRGQISEVSSWLASLPPELIANWPWLVISRAWVDLYMGRILEIKPLLEVAESKLDNVRNPATRARLAGHIKLIRAYLLCQVKNGQAAFELVTDALQLIPEHDLVGICHARIVQGFAGYLLGKIDTSVDAFGQAMNCTQDTAQSHIRALALGYYALVLVIQGKNTQRAQDLCEQIMTEYSTIQRKSMPALAYPLAVLGYIYIIQMKYDLAIKVCTEALQLSRNWQHADSLHFALTILAEAYLSIDKLEPLKTIIEDIVAFKKNLTDNPPTISFAVFVRGFQDINYYLRIGQLEPVIRWAKELSLDTASVRETKGELLFYLMLLLQQKEYSKAVITAQKMIDHYDGLKLDHFTSALLSYQAVAYYGNGENEKALANIGRLVDMVTVEHGAQILHQAGQKMMALLKLALTKGIKTEKIRQILATMHKVFPQEANASSAGGRIYLAEHLTDREMEILKMLDSGRSSTELAKELVIATSTVRTHIKSIYNKLGVSHRIEAVKKAKELNII